MTYPVGYDHLVPLDPEERVSLVGVARAVESLQRVIGLDPAAGHADVAARLAAVDGRPVTIVGDGVPDRDDLPDGSLFWRADAALGDHQYRRVSGEWLPGPLCDTGWRDPDTGFRNGWRGSAAVRRVGGTVWLSAILQDAARSGDQVMALPEGMVPDRPMALSDGWRITAGGVLVAPASPPRLAVGFSWPVSGEWPTELGVAL